MARADLVLTPLFLYASAYIEERGRRAALHYLERLRSVVPPVYFPVIGVGLVESRDLVAALVGALSREGGNSGGH